MEDCIFCKIIAGEILSTKVYEDDEVLAFLDISQVTPGHTLVVPKKHVANIYEYDTDLAAKVFSRIPMLARAIKNSNPNILGLNILNNNGEVAYQSVFHSHIHLIPRYSKKEGFGLRFDDNSSKYDSKKLQEIANQIASKVEK